MVVPSDKIFQQVKHFSARMEKEDLRFMISENKIIEFLKMPQQDRDKYAARGEHQKLTMATLSAIEKKMTNKEHEEHDTSKTNKVLRLLSSSGDKHNVEQLKQVRMEHGAQSDEYKNALRALEQ